MGHIYRFTDTDGSWQYLGRPDFPAGETPSGNKKSGSSNSTNSEIIYLDEATIRCPERNLQFDIASRTTMLVELPDYTLQPVAKILSPDMTPGI